MFSILNAELNPNEDLIISPEEFVWFLGANQDQLLEIQQDFLENMNVEDIIEEEGSNGEYKSFSERKYWAKNDWTFSKKLHLV